MGLNKRYINYENTLIVLQENKLNEYYGKTELFIFEDNICEYVYELHAKGETPDEILKKLGNEENIN